MGDEQLPLPINVDPSNFRISASLIGTNKNATGDTKDMFFFGNYVSSGTKYAALYRNTANARLTFAITSTEPLTTVAGITAKSLQAAAAYCAQVNCTSATASRVAYVDGAGAILAAKLPFAASYAQLYVPKYSLSYPATNTFQTFGNNMLAGTITSDWSVTAASPGYGLLYTGPNAYIEICYFVSYLSGSTKYTTLAVGAGIPTPSHAVGTQTQYSTYSSASSSFATGHARTVFSINTNDSVILYTASATIASFTINTVHVHVRVLGYI